MRHKILIVQLRSRPYAEHEKVCFQRNAAKYYPDMEFVNVLTEEDEAPRSDDWGIFSHQLRRERNPSEAEFSSYSSVSLRSRFSAKGDKLPKTAEDLQKYSCVLIAGTGEYNISEDLDKPEVQRLITLQKLIIDNDFPYLGMCFGHQVLGYVLGSAVEKDEGQKEVGTVKLMLTEEGKKDKIFSEIESIFAANEGHKDSIMQVPPEATLLASSEKCLIQALRHKTNQYGVQFHAEMDEAEIVERLNLYITLNPETNYASNIEEVKAKTRQTPHAKEIFDAFFSYYHIEN